MNHRSHLFFKRNAFISLLILVGAATLFIITTVSADVGTAFTYQGQLLDSGGVVDDTCDIQFSLHDVASGIGDLVITETKTAVDVEEGLFTVELDFGTSAFGGDPRWLELAVRCPAGGGEYDTLFPRQPLSPTPYAMFAS